VAVSSVAASASRRIMSSPTATERSGFTVTNTGLSGRGCGSTALAGSSTPRSTGGERRRHHEDDQQHQHHVDERRDVDFVRLDKIVIARRDRPAIPPRTPPGLGTHHSLRSPRDSKVAAIAFAADQKQHLRRGVAEQRAIGAIDRVR